MTRKGEKRSEMYEIDQVKVLDKAVVLMMSTRGHYAPLKVGIHPTNSE